MAYKARLQWLQEKEEGKIELIFKEIIAEYPQKWSEFTSGKKGLAGFFMGELMKKTIMTITGIRPDFIRMSEIFKKLDSEFSIRGSIESNTLGVNVTDLETAFSSKAFSHHTSLALSGTSR